MKMKTFKNLNEFKAQDFKIFDKHSEFGYVYVIEYGNYIKVGCTQNPHRRVQELFEHAQYRRMYVGKIAITAQTKDFRELESKIHKHFKEQRVRNLELFTVKFDKAVAEISEYFKLLRDAKNHINYDEMYELALQISENEAYERFRKWEKILI